MRRAIVWLRQDLRLSDNEALHTACHECDEVIPLFIDDSTEESITQSTSSLGCASRVWLFHSLNSLITDLNRKKSSLVLRQGNALNVLQTLIEETKATHVYWNRCYEPEIRKRDEAIKTQLKKALIVKSFKGSVLLEPWENLKQDGTPYRVFTPYWKALMKKLELTRPLSTPHDFKTPNTWPKSIELNIFNLLPSSPVPSYFNQ